MNNAKVMSSDELLKLKEVKKLTAKVCCVEWCDNIGKWDSKALVFYLFKGMCTKHYERFKIHGDANKVLNIKGENRSKKPLYHTYCSIKARCYNPNTINFKNYGGRGIKMSDEWLNDFNQFERNMGAKPSSKHSIERRKVNEGYNKDNCYWATPHEQAANRRGNNKIVGVSKTENNTFNARLTINRKHVLSKIFKSESEAIEARKEAEMKYNIYVK